MVPMWTEEKLEELLATPTPALVDDMRRIDGDILVLGAGGKMGPSLCRLAQQAAQKAGVSKKIIAVSRFGDPAASTPLQEAGVHTLSCDLQNREELDGLPEVPNVIYMAGRKFGTDGNEWQTWGMNATLPAFVGEKYRNSRITVFSSGNIYAMVPPHTGGAVETDRVRPTGEYAMSCLARERAFEYASHRYGTKVFILRLNFAIDLRYGVLADIAARILRDEPIPLDTACFNCVWQGYANEVAIRGLLHADSPSRVMNVTGPETLSVEKTALKLGKLLDKKPSFSGRPQDDAYLSDASQALERFGYPSVPAETLVKWQAEWIRSGGRNLNKPTHFEERGGVY